MLMLNFQCYVKLIYCLVMNDIQQQRVMCYISFDFSYLCSMVRLDRLVFFVFLE